MVYSVKTFNNINQVGLKELGNQFQVDGDLAENPDAFILRSQITFRLPMQQQQELWSLIRQVPMLMRLKKRCLHQF